MAKGTAIWILLPIMSCISRVGLVDPLSIDVLCDASGMHVHVRFETPFEGKIYSKGYRNDSHCSYLPPQGMTSDFTFHIPRSRCGTESFSLGSAINQTNTVVFQKHLVLETSMDHVRKLSCESHFPVNPITSEGAAHNSKNSSIRTWMEIKSLAGPRSEREPLRNVKVGDEMIVAIYVKKPKQHSVRIANCKAYDEQTKNATVVSLLDSSGCPLQPQIFSSFEFIQKKAGELIVAFSHMTAFKFSEKQTLFITCGIDVCSGNCSSICPNNSSVNEHHSSKSSTQFLKRSLAVPDIFATRYTRDKLDKKIDESTARKVMKATKVALSSILKHRRGNRRLDSKTDNGSLFKKRYGELEHVTEKLKSSTATRPPVLRSDLNPERWNLSSASRGRDFYSASTYPKTSEKHGTTRHIELSKLHEVHSVSTVSTSKLKDENLPFQENPVSSHNSTVTKGLSILPADVVMNVDSHYLNENQPYCFSIVKFTVTTSCLLFLVLCLLIACILLTLNIRAINRRNSISRFLLYPYF